MKPYFHVSPLLFIIEDIFLYSLASSDLNLVKDEYLRSNMDDEGWVSISLIANFRRVSLFLVIYRL